MGWGGEEETYIDIYQSTKKITQQSFIDRYAFTSHPFTMYTRGESLPNRLSNHADTNKELADRPAIPDPFPNTTQNALIP